MYIDANVQSVSAFQAQIAQIPPLREMLDVERKKWSTLQADVLRFGADIFHKPLNIWTGKKNSCSNASSLQRVLVIS